MYTLLRVSVMALGLITNIFIVRKLSMNDFGIFSVALMFIGLVTTFGFSWSSSSILYYGSREKAKTGSINKTFWARNIIIAISLMITTILFVVFRQAINEYIGLNVTFLILVWLYISVAEDYLSQYFLAVKKQLMSSMLSITAKIIYLIMIIIFSFDVKTLIILNIISHATVLFYIFGINKDDVGSFEFDKNWFKEVLNFSLWQLFGFSGLYLINFGDTAVIKYFMTTEDIAIYNVAYKLFNAIASFSYVISSYYAGSVSQYFANNEGSKIKRFFYKERLMIFGLSTIAHVVVMVFSKPIITTLYGGDYNQSVSIFNILMIGSIFKFWGIFNMLYYNTNNRHMINQTLNIFSAIINVVLNIVLVPLHGLKGAATATVMASMITTVISSVYCEKRIFLLSKVGSIASK
jgi:O-antigen/teichoic acid export membrane protein